MDSVGTFEPSSEIPVDINDLLGRCLGRLDIVQRILEKFQGVLRGDLQELEDAVHCADADAIAHIAHRMKGASLSVAAHDLKQYAQNIEDSAISKKLDDVRHFFPRLKEECARFDNLHSIITIASKLSC